MTGADLCFLDATELAALIARGDVSAVEVTEAHLARIAVVNPRLNAIVTLDADGALAQARRADEARRVGAPLGPLHGLPVAHKDLFHTRGMRTTFGSPLFRNWIAPADSIVVERQRAAGAITLGKTNTPEFGAGSQTFNTVFGATRNPYDPARTCGGSSGGSAVALACGMVALADGSDLGGSLRNPANFCGVVGLRPSIGRVPNWPAEDPWNTLSVAGPMGRTVADVALLLSAIAGADPRAPLGLAGDPAAFRAPLAREVRGTRVAWSVDLGGLPLAPEVRAALAPARALLERMGCALEDATPDLHGADDAFRTQRAIAFAAQFGEAIDRRASDFKPAIVENAAYGRARSGDDVARAQRLRGAVFTRMQAFLERYAILAAPVNQVAPFPVELEYPREIDGVAMTTYMDWMRSCYEITVTGHPAIAVPCGMTADGLPVGIQFVGRFGGERALLEFAHAFEQASPPLPRPAR